MAASRSGFFSLFPSVSVLIVSMFFAQISASTMGNNCTTRASYIYCLDSTLPSTWYNNNSVIMNGWQMRVFLLMQNANGSIDLYCGFYCNGTCSSYLFSVVAVGGSSTHRLLWSPNGNRPVKANATVQLNREGLVLRDSDGSQVWASNTSSNSILGMNLNEAGYLVLFSNESDAIWHSDQDVSVNIPPPGTYITPNSSFPPGTYITPNSSLPPGTYITPNSSFPPGTYITPNSSLPPGTYITPNSSLPPGTYITPNSSLPKGNNTPKPPRRNGKKLVAVIAGSTAGGLLIISIAVVLYLVKIRRNKEEEDVDYDIKQVPGMPVRFLYDDLRVATDDFKERLGGGGFGTVFKGLLPDGTKIAVKRLDRMGQGMREFLAEVETIGSLHHFNLVRLIGFCVEKSCRLLVYEYMVNGSLEKWIFSRDQRPCLDWQRRKKVILDVAKGLAYLHEDCRCRIAHLDIKPQNILLDEHFNAKVSDFGLSQLIDRDDSQVSTTLRGTPGYIAPEWRKSKITVNVDIYSFGVVLLEVVCARRNLDRLRSESSCHLIRLLQEKAKEDRLLDIVGNLDEEMENHREEMVRMIKIGAWCLQDDPKKRPSMSTVVKVLEGVMEVDENIKYQFAHAMPSVSMVNDRVSSAPVESILSHPR